MKLSPKDFLLKEFPPKVTSREESRSQFDWKELDPEKIQEISDLIIELFKENNMTYTDAYAMLGYVRLDLDYRSERLKL